MKKNIAKLVRDTHPTMISWSKYASATKYHQRLKLNILPYEKKPDRHNAMIPYTIVFENT